MNYTDIKKHISCSWVKIPKHQDKVCHFGAGFIIGILSLLIAMSFGINNILSIWIASSIVVFIGTLKEVLDSIDSKFDIYDLIATVLGGLLSIIGGIVWLIL